MLKEIQQYEQAVNKVLHSALESLTKFGSKKIITDNEILAETFKVKTRTQILNAVGKKIQLVKLDDRKNIIPMIAVKKNNKIEYKKK